MDDVITLLTPTYTVNDVGQRIPTYSPEGARDVMVQRRQVSRSEFYQAAQAGLNPTYIFVLSHYTDYMGEPEVGYTDEFGVSKVYTIIRTYRPTDSDELELTVSPKLDEQIGVR